MAEIFALASGATASLSQAIKLFDRIRGVWKNSQDLPAKIDRHQAFLNNTKEVLELIEQQECLKTENVKATLVDIKETAQMLAAHLAKMSAQVEKGPIQGFTHQLFLGSEDEKQLDSIMASLTGQKTSLGVNLSLINVGLTQSVGQAVAVNTNAVNEMDKRLKTLFGEHGGLRIAKLIEGRLPNDDGTTGLDINDISEMAGQSGENVEATEMEVLDNVQEGTHKIRKIRNNKALKDALQVNTPVGMDIWAHMDVIIIEDNTADVNAAQYNYPIQSQDFLSSLRIKYGAK